ncbi:MAG: RNA polymerase subunit sigma-70 [Ponticaulis sp.]|nr:RNA polymerase subunit sigma-70 [Ponticaulis sp.]|tara:strand:- start:2591 stop:3124 length:534 start_codon:yes stop_codon:yes gene_type:complete
MDDTQGSQRSAKRAKLLDILRERRPSLMRFLSSRLPDEADAQDVAQDVYLRLVSVQEPESVENPEAYVFRVAANLANDVHKKRRRYDTVDDMETLSELNETAASIEFARQMETRSDIDQLDRILNDLPPLYRTVLLLRKRDGYSHADIAEKLGISPHTVHKYLKRALSACRTAWEED